MMLETPIDILRYVGPISLFLTLVAGYIIVMCQPMGRHVSISAHAAASKLQSSILTFSLLVFGFLFYTYLFFWLRPAYDVPMVFFPFIALAAVAQIVVALFPVSKQKGLGHRLHLLGGSLIALVILATLIIMVFFSSLKPDMFSYWFIILNIIYALLCLVLFTVGRRRHQNFLVFESLYILLFTVSITLVTIWV